MKKPSPPNHSPARPYSEVEKQNEELPRIAEPEAVYPATPSFVGKSKHTNQRRISGYAVSDEAWRFAVANDLIPHLETAMRLVHECFPTLSEVQLLHEIDREMENKSWIAIEIKITGSQASILEQYNRFTLQMIRQVPPAKREKILLGF